MSGGLRKTLSVVIVCFTALGILLSLFLLVQVWRYHQPVSDKLQIEFDQFSGVLHTTDDALIVINQVVKNVYTSTLYLDDITNALSQTIQSTNLFISDAGTFVGDNLISTITNTQAALDSAQASAKVIDNILTTMSRIPLIGIDYNPEVPLNIALGDVSSSLDPLPEVLQNFQSNLNATYLNLQVFTVQISTLDQNITSITNNMEQAQVTIADYRTQLTSLISWVDAVKNSLPTWMSTITWVVTIIIIWLLLIQISIFLQGLSALVPYHSKQDVPGEKQ
ncbi:MAG: hypothetical protein WAV05_02675 [Anaerolineales bacterium]